MQNLIPAPDVLPLPAPPWLFLSLLILTFTVHVVFMNLLFGGTILALVSGFRGRSEGKHALLAQTIFKFMPINIAIAVNFGIAPLLFVQILYGNLLYSSSILISLAWFGIIPLIILGYYGTYTLRYRLNKLGRFRMVLLVIVPAIFATIAFFFVNNLSLVQRPEIFVEHYFKDPSAGTLNWADMSVYPRYLHILFGAFAVCGIWFMFIGTRGRTGDGDWSAWLTRYGWRIFVIFTLVNILVGLWFLLVIPERAMMIFLGRNAAATVIFAVSVILTFAAIYLLKRVHVEQNPGKPLFTGAGVMLAVLILMFIMRQYMRAAYLEPYFTLGELRVEPQWGTFAAFAATMILLMIPCTYYLVRVCMKMRGSADY